MPFNNKHPGRIARVRGPQNRHAPPPPRHTPLSAPSPASRCTRSAGSPGASRPRSSSGRAPARAPTVAILRARAAARPSRTSTRIAPAKSMSAPASVPSASVSRPPRRRIAPAVQLEAVEPGPGDRHRVGDEEDAVLPALRRQRHPQRRRRHVDAVGDQPGGDALGVERRPDEPRLAVAELAHRVEEMRHRAAPRPRTPPAPPPRRCRNARG